VADPDATVVALSGDDDFQFMIEELAVGAQFSLPYIHVLVNNAYLGLIRQSQRASDMDYCDAGLIMRHAGLIMQIHVGRAISRDRPARAAGS
jgi:glyoxylate carboligase